jgi:hypothetical protein
MSDPGQCILNRPQEMRVASVQTDMKVCFGVGVRVIDKIPWLDSVNPVVTKLSRRLSESLL